MTLNDVDNKAFSHLHFWVRSVIPKNGTESVPRGTLKITLNHLIQKSGRTVKGGTYNEILGLLAVESITTNKLLSESLVD